MGSSSFLSLKNVHPQLSFGNDRRTAPIPHNHISNFPPEHCSTLQVNEDEKARMEKTSKDPNTALVQTLGSTSKDASLEKQLSLLSMSDNGKSSASSGTDYQVFILAGFGHNLYPLTEEDNLPKALLPIANTPLLFYPLEWCQKAGFQSVTVVCHAEAEKQITAYTASLSLGVTIQVQAPSSVEDNLGSADVLRLLSKHITRDFIAISCDSFTSLPQADFLRFHETQNSSVTALFFDASQNADLVNLKLKENDSSLYVGYEKSSHRLLFVKPAINVHEFLDVRTSLLWRYPRMTVTTTLQDAHVYIFKHWVVDLINKNKKIASLRTDLLPMLAKMQWQSNLRKRDGIDELLPSTLNTQTTSQDDLPPNLKLDSPVSVSLYITPSSHYTLRANSWQTYLLLNQHLALLTPGPKKHPSSKAGAKTSVGQDSLVAENGTLGERVQIRGSILGTTVNVGSRSVIRGSVIMEGVEIGENVKVEGCIICRGAKIGERVSLTECRVAAGYHVQDGTKLSKENLIQLDELEDEDDEDEDDELSE